MWKSDIGCTKTKNKFKACNRAEQVLPVEGDIGKIIKPCNMQVQWAPNLKTKLSLC